MLKMEVQGLIATNCTTLLIISDTVHTKLRVHTLLIAYKAVWHLLSILLAFHVAGTMLLLTCLI